MDRILIITRTSSSLTCNCTVRYQGFTNHQVMYAEDYCHEDFIPGFDIHAPSNPGFARNAPHPGDIRLIYPHNALCVLNIKILDWKAMFFSVHSMSDSTCDIVWCVNKLKCSSSAATHHSWLPPPHMLVFTKDQVKCV